MRSAGFFRFGSYSAQLVPLYLQKIQHKFFNFNFIEAVVHQWKHWFLTHHLQILGSFVLAVSLFVYYLFLFISITNFMSNLKRALII